MRKKKKKEEDTSTRLNALDLRKANLSQVNTSYGVEKQFSQSNDPFCMQYHRIKSFFLKVRTTCA
jgi:hypothetical protein